MKTFIVAMAVFASVATSHAQSTSLWAGFVYPSMEHFKRIADTSIIECRKDIVGTARMILHRHEDASIGYTNDDFIVIETGATIFVLACAPVGLDLDTLIAEVYLDKMKNRGMSQ